MSGRRPPRWARRIVEAVVGGPHREWILGDLEEMYAARRGNGPPTWATLVYLGWGLGSGAGAAWRSVGAGARGDVGSALRQLRSRPRVYLAGSVVLASGLGVAVFVWGIHHGTFGLGLPVSEPDRMMALRRVEPRGGGVHDHFSRQDLERLRDAPGLRGMALWGARTITLVDGSGPPVRAETLQASPAVFELLEARAHLGRLLLPSDADPESPRVAVLEHGFWERRYEADPGILGRTVRVDGLPTEIVGVLTPGRTLLSGRQFEQIYLPLGERDDRDARSYRLLARAAPGLGPEEVSARLAGMGGRLDPAVGLRAVPFAHSFGSWSEDAYGRVLSLTGALLFLLAVANVSNLFLVRATTRSREMAVRQALGAGRLRILRQLAFEAAVPALLGIVGGALVAGLALDWYQAAEELYVGGQLAPWREYRLGIPHLWLLAAGAVASTIAVSLVAGVVELRRGSAEALRGGRGATTRFRLGRGLVAVEMAVGGALLLLTALTVRSGWNLHTVDWGFTREGIVTGRVVLGASGYETDEERIAFWRTLEEEVAGAPGIGSVSLSTQLPMIRYGGPTWEESRRIEIEGLSVPLGVPELPVHYVNAVSPGFFETFQSPLAAGRGFTGADRAGTEPVAVVNADFRERYFAGSSPLGRRIRIWLEGEAGPWRTVVGVAPHLWMDSDENRRPEGVYVPLAQAAPREASFAVRAADDGPGLPALLRETVEGLDPGLPVTDLMTMSEVIRLRTRLYRQDAPLFISLGLTAFLLALAGTWVVVSYLASRRAPELAIRAALGAGRGELVRRSALSTFPPVLAGAGGGMILGLIMVRGFERHIFQVDPWSPAMVAATFLLLVAASLGAGLLPALRAARVDLRRVLGDAG